jgi:hypothetical protein
MANLVEMLKELRDERSYAAKQIRRLDKAIAVLRKLGGRNHLELVHSRTRGPRRKLSAAARRKIAAAQRARWARVREKQQKKAA